jgi:hypothetical protein
MRNLSKYVCKKHNRVSDSSFLHINQTRYRIISYKNNDKTTHSYYDEKKDIRLNMQENIVTYQFGFASCKVIGNYRCSSFQFRDFLFSTIIHQDGSLHFHSFGRDPSQRDSIYTLKSCNKINDCCCNVMMQHYPKTYVPNGPFFPIYKPEEMQYILYKNLYKYYHISIEYAKYLDIIADLVSD